jgi:hypothetical protein
VAEGAVAHEEQGVRGGRRRGGAGRVGAQAAGHVRTLEVQRVQRAVNLERLRDGCAGGLPEAVHCAPQHGGGQVTAGG